MIESKGWLLLALVFAVLLVLLNLSTIEKQAPSPLLGKITEEKFDYAMKKMVSYQFDEQGDLVSTLKADDLFHYPQRQLIQLEKPTLNFKISEQLWSLSADKGSLSEISEELMLTEIVTITNQPTDEINHLDSNMDRVTVQINELFFNMREQLAYSQNSVTLASDKWLIQGDGFSMDIDKQILKILNNVEAVHEMQ